MVSTACSIMARFCSWFIRGFISPVARLRRLQDCCLTHRHEPAQSVPALLAEILGRSLVGFGRLALAFPQAPGVVLSLKKPLNWPSRQECHDVLGGQGKPRQWADGIPLEFPPLP